MPDSDRMIRVVQTCRSAWRVQRSGASGIFRADIIEAVARGQVSIPAQVMVHLAGEKRGTNRLWILAGRDQRSTVANIGQSRIDRRDICRRDRGQPGLVEMAALDVHEVERAIARDRAAGAEPELRLLHRQLGAREGVPPVEAVVSLVEVHVAAQPVRAALRHDADEAAEGPAQFRLPSSRDDLHLVYRVDAERQSTQARGIVVRGKAVHEVAVREIALTVDRKADARNGRRLRKQLAGSADVGRRDAGRKQREVEGVAAVERQSGNLRSRDCRRDLAARGLEQRRLGRHGHVGHDRRERQRDGQLERGAGGERQTAR